MSVKIHDTAIINEGAELGENVEVGPYSVIGSHVRVGDGSTIGSCVLLDGHTTIGKGNIIYHGASIGTPPQDLKFRGETTFVKIGDSNTIREFATVNAAVGEGGATRVGSNCLLMAYSHVAHNCFIGDNVILSNAVNLAGHVTIGDWVILGGMTPVHQFVCIGAHAYIGGGSRIAQDIPPFFKFAGNPPKENGLNSVGLERRGFTLEQMNLLKKAYKLLYRSDLNVTQALERITSELEQTPEITMLVDFIRNSVRGLTK